LTAEMNQPGSQLPGKSNGQPRPSGIAAPGGPRMVCSRDDYAFLPASAQAGIPCESSSSGAQIDPRQVGRSLFDQLDLPSLRLNMNPRRGMVAVPTWFWVEGYDGNVIPLEDNLVLTREECRRVVDRGEDGTLLLDPDGAPRTRRDCRTIRDTLTVELRVWPKTYAWRFGDDRSKTVHCPGIAACPQGIGQPYVSPHAPSPIAHTYTWSSLGANGASDAYSIGLGITFGAQYRFSINGGSSSGWQMLDERDLSWSATHQVQEAQAVLTRP
jgi:hypothetical protein